MLHSDRAIRSNEEPIQIQCFNDPSRNSLDLAPKLRYVRNSESVFRIPRFHPLNKLTDSSSEVQTNGLCQALGFNPPLLTRLRVRTYEINPPMLFDRESSGAEEVLDGTLDEAFVREFDTAFE